MNETKPGWAENYELLWADETNEAVEWVQREFDYFWNTPYAVPLGEFIVEDLKRISERKLSKQLTNGKATQNLLLLLSNPLFIAKSWGFEDIRNISLVWSSTTMKSTAHDTSLRTRLG